MKVKDLKLALDQYDDEQLVHIDLHMGVIHRINKCIIEPTKYDGDLYDIKTAEKDNKTNSLILTIE